MPPDDPSDDFSQLPTADGHAPRGDSTGPARHRRPQTRIGPRAAAPASSEEGLSSEAPAKASHAASSLADDWQELLQDTDLSKTDDERWTSDPTPVPPPKSPRRTVVGSRAIPPEALQASAEPPSEPSPRTPRRTVVGRKPAAIEEAAGEKNPNHEALLHQPDSPSFSEAPAVVENTPSPNAPPEEHSPASRKTPSAKSADHQDAKATRRGTAPKSGKDPAIDTSAAEGAKAEAQQTEPGECASEEKDKNTTQAESTPTSVAELPASPWYQRWDKWGGRALSVSVLIHVLLLAIGTTFVVTQVLEPQTDFLPGGGTTQGAEASRALEHQIQQKKSPWLKKALPARRIAAVGSISDIVLPDEVPDLLDLPSSKDLLSGGKLTAGMGLAGAGGGIGKGMGLGSKSGMVFQPFSMFGMQIKAKRLALVLDVSTSMAPHLPRVIEEVDKVAKGSVVVLYFGCGLEAPPPAGIDGDDVFSTSSSDFEKFWRLGGATLTETRKYRINPKDAIPSEAVFRMLSKRPQTYFIHNTGLGYTWLALLSEQVRNADGIYWFSDFQDRVEFKQVNIVRENLGRRKQRLYMHAYMRGSAFDLVRTQLAEPTGGDVKVEDE